MVPSPKARATVAFGSRGALAPAPPGQKALVAKARRLEQTKANLSVEVNEFRDKLQSHNQLANADEQRFDIFRNLSEQLRAQIEELGQHQQFASQREDEVEAGWQDDRCEHEDNIEALRAEASLWRQRAERLTRQVAQREAELQEIGEETLHAVQERRQIQAECLSLQQECENARLDLHGAQDMLKDAGAALESMQMQRLQLERALQERKQQQVALKGVMNHAGQALKNEAELERKRHVQMIASGQLEVERLRAEMDNHQKTAVAYQQAVGRAAKEMSLLQEEIAKGANNNTNLERQVHEAQQEAKEEKRLETMARELLLTTRARREQLEKYIERLRGESTSVSRETVELQDKHARFVLKEAQHMAAKVLQKEPGSESKTPKPVADQAEPTVYAGFFMPAGAARAARERVQNKQHRRHPHQPQQGPRQQQQRQQRPE